jgi:putative membrane protein
MISDRLHPAGVVILALGALRELALPLGGAIAVIVFGGGLDASNMGGALLAAIGGAVFAAGAGVVRWRTTTYAVDDRSFRLRTGLLTRKEIVVPRDRIQSIDTVQGPVQRLFGVVALQVQAAGGGRGGEISLEAVSAERVREIRALVGGEAAAEAAPAGPARRLGYARLAAAALTAGQIGVLLPVVAAVLQVGSQGFGGRDLENRVTRWLPESALGWAGVAAGLLVLAWLISAAGAAIAFGGFRVEREGERLRIQRGLGARRQATVPVGRVQAVIVVEGLLRQPFGLCTLRADVAGWAAEGATTQTLFPLLRLEEVEPFLRELLPEQAGYHGRLERPPPRAVRRYVLAPLLLAAAVAAAGSVAVPGAFPWALGVLFLGAGAGFVVYRAAGWRLADGRLAVRSRTLARRTVLTRVARLQSHGVTQSPLQRRAGLCHLTVSVGSGTAAAVRHLDASTAWGLWRALREGRRAGGYRGPAHAP